MRKRYGFLVLLALGVISCNALSLPLWDLSTDAGVIQAYNTITEQNLGAEDLCIHRPDGLKEVVVIGRVQDEKCQGDELFAGQTLGRFDTLTDEGLALNGWNDRTRRETLALQWVEEVLFAWHTPLEQEDDAFQTSGIPFSPPSALAQTDDSIRVELWVRAGTLPKTHYTQYQVVFDSNGTLSSSIVLNEFTVSDDP